MDFVQVALFMIVGLRHFGVVHKTILMNSDVEKYFS